METDKFKLAQRFIKVLIKLMLKDDFDEFIHLSTALTDTLYELEQVCNEQEMDAFYDALKTAGYEVSR